MDPMGMYPYTLYRCMWIPPGFRYLKFWLVDLIGWFGGGEVWVVFESVFCWRDVYFKDPPGLHPHGKWEFVVFFFKKRHGKKNKLQTRITLSWRQRFQTKNLPVSEDSGGILMKNWSRTVRFQVAIKIIRNARGPRWVWRTVGLDLLNPWTLHWRGEWT